MRNNKVLLEKEVRPKGKILTRVELAYTFGVSKSTIDEWVRRGCPVRFKGGKGVPSEYDTARVFDWALQDARSRGRWW